MKTVSEQSPLDRSVLSGIRQQRLFDRASKPERNVLEVQGLEVGGAHLVVTAGRCAVESQTQILTVAHVIAAVFVHFLRGGAFKPQTSPLGFRGHGVGTQGIGRGCWKRDAGPNAFFRVKTH